MTSERPTPDPDTQPLPWWTERATLPSLPPDRIRMKNVRARLVGAAAAFAALALTLQVSANAEVPISQPTQFGQVYSVDSQGIIGGCTDRINITETLRPDGVIPDTLPNGEPFIPPSQITSVPTRGFMYAPPVDVTQQNFFNTGPDAPSPFSLLNNMWSGALVVYYNPVARQSPSTDLNADLEALRRVAAEKRVEDPGFRMIVAPWPVGEDGRPLLGGFPGDRPFALAAWGNVQYCYRFVAPVAGIFRDAVPAYSAPGADGTSAPVLPEDEWTPIANSLMGGSEPSPSPTPVDTAASASSRT